MMGRLPGSALFPYPTLFRSASGPLGVASGALLLFPSSYLLNAGAVLPGPGTTRLAGGNLTVAAAADLTARGLEIVGGTLDGGGTLTIPAGATLDWTGGVMSG